MIIATFILIGIAGVLLHFHYFGEGVLLLAVAMFVGWFGFRRPTKKKH